MALPLTTRLALRALAELEERGHIGAARAGYLRLWSSLHWTEGGDGARLQVAQGLLRLGLASGSAAALTEGCAAWRELGGRAGDEELRARAQAIALVRTALADRRVADAATLADAEAERAPDHALALYARGRLAAIEGDTSAAEALLERAAALAGESALGARAQALLGTLPDERLPRAGEALPKGLPAPARLALAARLARSGGRYARVRGLDVLLEALEDADEARAAAVLAVAARHIDVVGVRLTEIERDRLRELLRRMPAGLASTVATVTAALELRARLAPLSPAARLEWLASEGPDAAQPLARALARGAGPWPESHDPHAALAAEALRVVDALREGAPVSFARLLELFAAAGPTAALVPTLWALVPAYVARHGALGLAREALRPLLQALLEQGPHGALDPALVARALGALGDDDLAERAARRAAEAGDGQVLSERLVERAFRLAAAQPAEALRLLERAERVA